MSTFSLPPEESHSESHEPEEENQGRTPNDNRKTLAKHRQGYYSDDLSKLLDPVIEDEDCETELESVGAFEDILCSPVHKLLGYTRLPCADPADAQTLVAVDSRPRVVVKFLRQAVLRLLQSVAFQCCTVTCILANAIIIGLETDFPAFPIWDQVEMVFLLVFTLEVVFRLFVHGPQRYFCACNLPTPRKKFGLKRRDPEESTDVLWNIFDFSIVGCGWMMVLLECFVGGIGGGRSDATLLRAVRLLRLLRILRVVRVVRFLKQLYLLAYGFLEGASAVFWVAVLAASLIYLCAVVLVRAYHAKSPEDASYDFFEQHFENIPGAMFTLFQTMASPNLGLYRPVLGQEPLLAAFIVPFVIFGSLGMNGLLTGVISESIMEKNQARIEASRQEREAQRRMLESSCTQLFDEVVGPRCKQMTINQFRLCMEDIKGLTNDAGASVVTEDLESMFMAMDYSDSGMLDKIDFVHGILELCEDVRPMSIMEIHCQLSRCQMQMEQCNAQVQELVKASRIRTSCSSNQACRSPVSSDEESEVGGQRNSMSQLERPKELSPLDLLADTSRRSSCEDVSRRSTELPTSDPRTGAPELATLAQIQRQLATAAKSGGSASARAELAALGRELGRLVKDNCDLLQQTYASQQGQTQPELPTSRSFTPDYIPPALLAQVPPPPGVSRI